MRGPQRTGEQWGRKRLHQELGVEADGMGISHHAWDAQVECSNNVRK
jgi:hypothetical protein